MLSFDSQSDKIIKSLPEEDSLDINSLTINDPDVTKTFAELADEYGCVTNDYFVTTEDGYVLHMFRLRNKYGFSSRGKPVFL